MEGNINYFNNKSAIDWDQYFMVIAMTASFKSKDPTRKVGAVFIDQENKILSMGYNGFVAGLDEKKLPWGKDPSQPLEHQKYGYVVHAEANAIMHAAPPTSLTGAKLYVTLFPCNECAKMLASLKITEVIYLSDRHRDKNFNIVSKRILEMASIPCRQIIPKENILDEFNQHLKDTLLSV